MKKKSVSICVFIDAFGWDLMKTHPFLDDVLTHKQPLDTIFGYSSTCDPTILTGLLPRDHGHFSFFAYDPEHSPFRRCLFIQLMRLVPKSLSSRGRVRNIASRILRRRLGYTGYFNIYNMPFKLLPSFDYTEKKDLYQRGGINSGSDTIMDYARDNRLDFFLSDWKASETENLTALTQSLTDPKRNVQFAYLYMASMDAILHQWGTQAKPVEEKIKWYEEQLRTLLATAHEQYEEVRVHLFSDHGMTDIESTCDLMPYIEKTGLVFGEDYAAVYDSTIARFWFLKPHAEKIIREALKSLDCGAFLSQETMNRYGIDFPDNRYGDDFYLLNPGVLLVPSHMGERPLKGMHGYAIEHHASVASYASNVQVEQKPKRLDDLYAIMKGEIDRCLKQEQSQ